MMAVRIIIGVSVVSLKYIYFILLLIIDERIIAPSRGGSGIKLKIVNAKFVCTPYVDALMAKSVSSLCVLLVLLK